MSDLATACEQIAAALRMGKRVRALVHPKSEAIAVLLERAGVEVSRTDSGFVREGEVAVFVEPESPRYTYRVPLVQSLMTASTVREIATRGWWERFGFAKKEAP